MTKNHPSALTLAGLAEALRGMPRDAAMCFRAPDGTLHPIRLVTGYNTSPMGNLRDHGRYVVTLMTKPDDEWKPDDGTGRRC